ncbi:hypothetical protein [Streptomyces sp. NPDC059874]|uniref:hypothetical protein n=1 Tax=Streptomyces sp. NPDC059874 TaxID=3346983 RepID=UPI0036584320
MDEVFVNSTSPASRWASSALLLMVAVAGCTSQPDRSTDSPRPAHAVFDPPSKFDAKAGIPMPKAATAGLISSKGKEMELLRNPVALFKEKAYVATRESLLAVDTTSGAVSTITPEATPVKAPEADGHGSFLFSQPVSITEGAGPLVLASFVVQQPAFGTHSGRVFVEFTAVNAASGRVEWRLPLNSSVMSPPVAAPNRLSAATTKRINPTADPVTAQRTAAATTRALFGTAVRWRADAANMSDSLTLTCGDAPSLEGRRHRGMSARTQNATAGCSVTPDTVAVGRPPFAEGKPPWCGGAGEDPSGAGQDG